MMDMSDERMEEWPGATPASLAPMPAGGHTIHGTLSYHGARLDRIVKRLEPREQAGAQERVRFDE